MDAYLFLAGSFTVVALSYLLTKWRQRANQQRPAHPPGPPGLPLVGNLFQMGIASMGESFCKWANKYGHIYRITLGRYNVVVLSDPQLIRDTFTREEFINRPLFPSVKERSRINNGSHGIVFAEGEAWKEHRRFVLQTFRDFGVGKSRAEEKIAEEAAQLVKFFAATDTQPINTKGPISAAVANVIGEVLTGTRYDPNDPHFLHFLELNHKNFQYTWQRAFVGLLPWTRKFPVLKDKYKDLVRMYEGLRDFFKKTTDEHLQNWSEENQEDFLNSYISAVKSTNYPTFSTAEIPLLLEDLFEAGYDTTTTTLRWALLLAGVNPDVQKKIHLELENKELLDADLQTLVASGHKHTLPYIEAFLLEVHRFASIAPLGVPHLASADTQIASFYVPKGSWIIACLRAVHHSERHWPSPEKFNPERFLTTDGQLTKVPDNLIPFSLGKRRCLGESLARSELYIFFVSIMRAFIVLPVGDENCEGLLPDGRIDLRPLPGLTADAKPHRIQFIHIRRLSSASSS